MKNITTITIILLLCIAMGCYLFLGGSREENSQISDIDTEYSFLKYVAGEKYGAVDFYGLFQDKIEYSYQVDDWVEVNKDKYIYLGPQWSIVDINNLNNEKEIAVSYSSVNDLFEEDESIKQNPVRSLRLTGCNNDLWKLNHPDVEEYILVVKVTDFIKMSNSENLLPLDDNKFELKGECVEIIGGETGY